MAVALAAARVEVAAVVVTTMAVVLVSPLTLYRPSATVLIHFVLKLVLFENKKSLEKFVTRKLLVREHSSPHQMV